MKYLFFMSVYHRASLATGLQLEAPRHFFGSGNFLNSALNKFPACSMFFISLHGVIINDALPLSFYDFFFL